MGKVTPIYGTDKWSLNLTDSKKVLNNIGQSEYHNTIQVEN